MPTDAERRPGGFGVRVIHSGVWGFASSPIVNEDEIRRVTRLATEIARASAMAKKADVRLAPVPAYVEHWVTPMVKDPTTISESDRQAWAHGQRLAVHGWIYDLGDGLLRDLGVTVEAPAPGGAL